MNKVRRHILEFQDCITAIEKCDKRASIPPDGPLGIR